MSTFNVQLAMNMDADNPGDAVDGFVDQLTDQGSRNWVYKVNDEDGKLVGFYNGWGSELDTDKVLATTTPTEVSAADINAELADVDDDTDGDSTSSQEDETSGIVPNEDAELLALAATENAS